MFSNLIINLIIFLIFMICVIFSIRNANKENYTGCLFFGVTSVFCVAIMLIRWCFQNWKG